MSEGRPWEAALVLTALRLALTSQPTLLRFTVDRARGVLGEHSLDYVALVLRAAPAPGLSIREMCREHYGWRGSRSELYRRSHNGLIRLAAALSRDGVPVPDALQTPGDRVAPGHAANRPASDIC
jgi:hypothetical protein